MYKLFQWVSIVLKQTSRTVAITREAWYDSHAERYVYYFPLLRKRKASYEIVEKL